ncbi:M55 family metallopeptidase [Tepidibacillus fermentans]|uniref:D-amino peptidase n=1 Tax=Tepidibacillus fermentans TaxID=1281767 RepID=A0A4R3KLG1_9BACI|nr:M55 family metallopeptidase [Tepidibacillus fermentans]TCS84196.1 D-amino peptidase [Tepidibacillus fermentans]
MKIYISVDMEGISGVATNMQLKKNDEYNRFRKLMTQDVNAAIEGAFRGGATEVVVADGHGNMSNILIEELDPRARLISGNNRVMCQMEGIDDSFDGVFFVGYHGREGGSERSVISHTLAGIAVNEMKINGKVVGESELNAGVAGFFGVPVLLVTGDDVVTSEIKSTLPDVETVVVKRGIDRFAAELLPLQQAHELIRTKAELAVKKAKQIKPYHIEGPITFEIEFKGSNQALMTTTIPSVELIGPKRIRFTCNDYITAYKMMWGLVIIGMSATNGVLGHANA